jgi:hypothetical protein
MRSRLAAVVLVAVLSAHPCLAQRPPAVPRIAGVTPGQLRSQVARALTCQPARDSTGRLDSIYAAYRFTLCQRVAEGSVEATLYFVRDTLIRVVAPDRAGPALPSLPPDPVVSVPRYMATVWDRYRSRAVTMFGSEPDSTRTVDNPPVGGYLLATLTAYWTPNPTRRWNARLELITIFQAQRVSMLPRSTVEDACVTTVPWLVCPSRR